MLQPNVYQPSDFTPDLNVAEACEYFIVRESLQLQCRTFSTKIKIIGKVFIPVGKLGISFPNRITIPLDINHEVYTPNLKILFLAVFKMMLTRENYCNKLSYVAK